MSPTDAEIECVARAVQKADQDASACADGAAIGLADDISDWGAWVARQAIAAMSRPSPTREQSAEPSVPGHDAEPVKMLVDQEWLTRHVETDPDLDCEAGHDAEGVEAGDIAQKPYDGKVIRDSETGEVIFEACKDRVALVDNPKTRRRQ